MARVGSAGRGTDFWDQPNDVKMARALEWLRENPDEKATIVIHLYCTKNERSVQQV